MLPTLFGRWQTRLFMLATVGVLFSLPFYFGIVGNHQGDPVFFWVLLYVGIFGLFWDILYDFLQKLLWDHDWPGILQFAAAVTEGIFLALVIKIVGLPLIDRDLGLGLFFFDYFIVWAATYLFSWLIMRLLFPRWRFRGGEWIGRWPY